MAHSRFPTRLVSQSNCVVLVGGAGLLKETVQYATLSASGAQAVPAEVASAASVAAEMRPYAIIVPEDVYQFGGQEFDALARDVDAGLVVVPRNVPLAVLTAMLGEEASRLG